MQGTDPTLQPGAQAAAFRIRPWHRLAVVLLLLCQIAFCWTARARSLHGLVDFRVFYTAGHMVLTHHGTDLYDLHVQQQVQTALFGGGQTLPFLYPPFMAPLFAPFALLPYGTAFAIALLIDLGLLLLSLFLLRAHSTSLRALPAPLFAAAGLCLFPVAMALMQGQVTFLLLLLFTGVHLLLRGHRPFLAGCVLALALLKFQLALPVAVLFLLWKQRRAVAGFLCGAVLLAAASVAVAGPHGVHAYFDEIAGITRTTVQDPARAHASYGMAASDMPNLHGLCAWLTHGTSAGQALCVLATLGLLAWAFRQRPSVALALPCAMLVSYHMQAYDLVLLLLPLLNAAGERMEHGWQGSADRAVFCGTLVCLFAPVAPALLVAGLGAFWALTLAGCAFLQARIPGPANLQPDYDPAGWPTAMPSRQAA